MGPPFDEAPQRICKGGRLEGNARPFLGPAGALSPAATPRHAQPPHSPAPRGPICGGRSTSGTRLSTGMGPRVSRRCTACISARRVGSQDAPP